MKTRKDRTFDTSEVFMMIYLVALTAFTAALGIMAAI